METETTIQQARCQHADHGIILATDETTGVDYWVGPNEDYPMSKMNSLFCFGEVFHQPMPVV